MTEKELMEWFPNMRDVTDLFRLAHLHCFGKDITYSGVVHDLAGFHATGHLPKYVKRYLDEVVL